MSASSQILEKIIKALKALYPIELPNLNLERTNPDFKGDYTFVTFQILKSVRKSPEAIGKEVGEYLTAHDTEVASYNVVKGFLNLTMSDKFWMRIFSETLSGKDFGMVKPGASGKTVLVEYSSPNTNKPLHLGHIRNNLLGYSVAELLK